MTFWVCHLIFQIGEDTICLISDRWSLSSHKFGVINGRTDMYNFTNMQTHQSSWMLVWIGIICGSIQKRYGNVYDIVFGNYGINSIYYFLNCRKRKCSELTKCHFIFRYWCLNYLQVSVCSLFKWFYDKIKTLMLIENVLFLFAAHCQINFHVLS